MPHDLTHASFFSGVGGLDLGLERAGWRTVSFSEIDPYASAVLAERWPGTPNLGDITDLASAEGARVRQPAGVEHGADWHRATLWTGGFPCQDLSVAGKRAGFAGERSSLAFAFLDLVEQHRPPAILLENVPGLLSSNGGKDLGALLSRLGELGYWWAYRILDAQFSGVPQRRRRVFIVALHAGSGFGADSAAAVLSVGARCDGHSAAGYEAGEGASASPERSVAPPIRAGRHGDSGIGRDNDHDRLIYNATAKFGEFVADDIAGNLSARDYKSSNHLISSSPNPGGVREADGLAGRLDDRPVAALDTKQGEADDNEAQAGHLVSGEWGRGMERRRALTDDVGLPLGLDSHRYRCCGNGVVSNVAEWIGIRLARAMTESQERAA